MTRKAANTAPKGLGPAGSALWKGVTESYELDPLELAALEHACRQTDLGALLDAQLTEEGISATGSGGQTRLNGLVGEIRQSRLAVAKLLTAIRLPPSAVDMARNGPERRDALALQARELKAKKLGRASRG